MRQLAVPDKIFRELRALERLANEFLQCRDLSAKRDLWHRILWSQEMIFHSVHCYALKTRGPFTNWLGRTIKARKKHRTMRYVSALRGYFEHSDQDGVLLLNARLGYRLEVNGVPLRFEEAVMKGMLGILKPDPPKTFRALSKEQLALPSFMSRGVIYSPPTLEVDILVHRVLEYCQDLVDQARKILLSMIH
jgi:hypothetical protein